MSAVVEALTVFVALYPVVTAAFWVAGGVLFWLLDESDEPTAPEGAWPGVTVLIPAYNEEQVIATSVVAALGADYPDLELLVLDDGSHDHTEAVALRAAAGDPRCRVIRDPVNRGKADRLNSGFAIARNDLVVVTDADTHLHPLAIKLLVSRMQGSPLVAAVAGAPHVTNRTGLICAMQVLEATAIIGLIRRAQALTGRVGTVAGVLGIFRRERVLGVGGYDGRMATEDIDLTWKLLMAGWQTSYEPRALVGMQVPSSLGALWEQRKRWARGQGEVLHAHMREVFGLRKRRMWLVSVESLASLAWVVTLAITGLIVVVQVALDGSPPIALVFGLAWGVAVSVVATLQLAVAILIDSPYDRREWRSFLVGPIYPLAYWAIAAAAALRCQAPALARGPRDRRVVWDIPRERIDASGVH